MSKEAQNSDLSVVVEGGRLVISVGIETLARSIENSIDVHGEPQVIDPIRFAECIRAELAHEEEDGTTPIHRLLDGAANSAIENGADGVEVEGDAS